MTDDATHPPLPPGTRCPRCNYEIGVPDAAACPECGLASVEIARVLPVRDRERALFKWALLASLILPVVLGAFADFVSGQSAGPLISSVVVVWLVGVLTCCFATITAPDAQRTHWVLLQLRAWTVLAALLPLVVVNSLLHPFGSSFLFWSAVVWTGVGIGVCNVYAWRVRREAREATMLRAPFATATFLILHCLFAFLVSMIALMSIVGDLIFVLPGQA